MRNMLKKLMTIFTASALVVTSAASLAACGENFTPLKDIPTGEVKSNGGFVTEVGDYLYFINGVQTYDVDNTYGAPVKGSLMRVKKGSLAKNEAEMVIPSLMVAADYSSGIYIYGDRVYYATPNNVKNTSGNIERDFLDFKSAKLDGSDIQSYFNVSDNSTTYRYVKAGEKVYLVYKNGTELLSYNTADKTEISLAKNVTGTPIFNKNDVEDPYVYYTMGVTMDIDQGNPSTRSYNQVYRVRADWTESPYKDLNEYEWSEDYLDKNDGELPYWNLGQLVLDGIGANFKNNPTIFSHDVNGLSDEDFRAPLGSTYTLQSYENGGLYFNRADITKTGTVGEDGWLYYISADKFDGKNWNSVTGNADANIDVVAQPTDTTHANSSALYYIENGRHGYLYVDSSNMFRANVDSTTGEREVTRIAQGVSGATLVRLDDKSDSLYKYVYYTVSGTSGNNIYRAVYNGTEENYKSLGQYEEANKPYRPVQVLNIQHARSWYGFEIIDDLLFFADAEALGASYNYISYVDLKGENGTLMNNVQLSEYNDKFNETVGTDGYLAKLDSKDLSTALRYYFYTGETQQFSDNIAEAKDKTGKENTLYSEEDVKSFEEYTSAKHDLRSDYIQEIGVKSEEDATAIKEYWRTTLKHYEEPTVEEPEDAGLPTWAVALIGIGIGLVVIIAGVTVWLVLRARGQKDKNKEEKMFVDTTDDRSMDVYSDEPVAPVTEEPETTDKGAAEPAQQDSAEEPMQPEETPTEPAQAEEAPAGEPPTEE